MTLPIADAQLQHPSGTPGACQCGIEAARVAMPLDWQAFGPRWRWTIAPGGVLITVLPMCA
jgi:hypothetical protein